MRCACPAALLVTRVMLRIGSPRTRCGVVLDPAVLAVRANGVELLVVIQFADRHHHGPHRVRALHEAVHHRALQRHVVGQVVQPRWEVMGKVNRPWVRHGAPPSASSRGRMPCADPLTVAHAASSPNRSYSLVISGPCAGARKDLELFDCHARTGGQGGRKNYEPPRIQAPSCARLTLTVRRRPAEIPGFPWSVPRVVLRVTSLSVRASLVTARVCSLGSSLWAVGVAPVSNGQRCYNPCRWSTVYRAR